MDNAGFQQAERAQLSILSKLEKRCLVWMAERMPTRVNSDHLTVLGATGMFLAGLCYWYARWNRLGLLLVILFLAVNWFGDSLDGTLARVRNRQRPRYGFYVDRSEEHTSELQSRGHLVCRLLLLRPPSSPLFPYTTLFRSHLTVLGATGMFLAGLCYWYARWNRLGLLLVILFLAVNWFGDSLDGTLARVRNRQRPRYGFYVD